MFVMVLIFFAVKWIPNIKKKTIMQMHKFLDMIHKSKKIPEDSELWLNWELWNHSYARVVIIKIPYENKQDYF